MKIKLLKALSVAVCCLVAALWTEIQGAEQKQIEKQEEYLNTEKLNLNTNENENDFYGKIINKKEFKIKMSNINLDKREKAPNLLISCIDFRIQDEIVKFMSTNGDEHLNLIDAYDEICLPGASFALLEKNSAWRQSILDVIRLFGGADKHDYKRIILLDHFNCAECKRQYPEVKVENEKKIHTNMLTNATKFLKEVYKDKFEIYSFLFEFHGGEEGKIHNLTYETNPELIEKIKCQFSRK
jgi:hypothetical protein